MAQIHVVAMGSQQHVSREGMPILFLHKTIGKICVHKNISGIKTVLSQSPLSGGSVRMRAPNSNLFMVAPSRRDQVLLAVHGQKAEATGAVGEDNELKHEVLSMQDQDDAELTVPVFSLPKVIEKMQENTGKRIGKQSYRAMYSSIFGGITTDPTLMVIPIDDHMVHRGHGVFDTALIIDGYLYELDAHLDRFLRSASMAKLAPFNRSYLRSILVQTVAASQCKQGALRYWLTAGPGDFSLSSSGCPTSAFYAVVIEEQSSTHRQGVKVVTSSIPMKPPEFAVMKNVNYLPNVLSKLEAEEKGAFAGIWLDNEGFIAEGPNMNVAFVNTNKELLMPSFEKILSGCTAKRLLALAPRLLEEGLIKGIRVGNIKVEEGKEAEEMMLVGSGVYVLPVVMWDEHPIGNGKEGPVTLALLNLLLEDMKAGPASVRIPVPYGVENSQSVK